LIDEALVNGHLSCGVASFPVVPWLEGLG